jgi:hypothetical protein
VRAASLSRFDGAAAGFAPEDIERVTPLARDFYLKDYPRFDYPPG